ncbi:MAG: hypothetical protein GEV11_03140 [Streptosporangiales bacterium]|nr:hypothetical protein [Streptosporangiales bacterium]
MTSSALPQPYSPAWVKLPETYVGRVADALVEAGIGVAAWWNDPSDPRDATIRVAPGAPGSASSGRLALVWDEETGWRYGDFVAGEQGVRTQLAWASYLGTDVLPEPAAVAAALRGALDGTTPPMTTPTVYRSHTDLTDGLDTRLAAYTATVG